MKELFKLLNVSKLLKDSHFKKLENERSLKDDRLLQKFESKTYSQNWEDWILTEIFSRIWTDSKYFVEFWIQDWTENCTRNLLENWWSWLWIEADKKSHDAAKEKFKDFNILLINDFITIKNINSLFEKAKVPNNLDLLVIDIDWNDYWIWNEITEYSPKVICMEYNWSYSPNKSWIMPYNATHEWNWSNNFWASLESYTELWFKKWYYLVWCDSQWLNAFFVRKDLVKDNFSNIFEKNNSYHYSYPKYNPYFFWHPKPFVISIIKKLNKLWI
ncbi:MAG: hypothetical protein ACD_3C00158G0005 [uncultured bacterium (gcode 4)]|uniref:Methyltransferase FkbM domain-containing protein n=1 Tax=uncultured bacterium (gcode 4) TaxID=1234023 RepID=K2F9G1_9BACT|nr:MAG: hypothetical protein ACD_3C00158G0005 [uncultured bacterium (gcode 4)]